MDDITPSLIHENVLRAAETSSVDSKSQSGIGGPTDSPDSSQRLSKKAIKKAARTERLAAAKIERRAREKEAKKEKKRVIVAKRAAGELDEEDSEKDKRRKKPRLDWSGKVMIDLGFDERMSEKEIKSLCSQLAYTYSANRNAAYPFSLIYTSLNGRTFTRLESMNDAGYKRWTNTEWWVEGYDRLWRDERPSQADELMPKEGTHNEQFVTRTSSLVNQAVSTQKAPQERVVYLTADSEVELTELKAEEIYIIGGICDHNRYKNLCLNKAKETGIRTARLPIGRYLASLPTRKVLTVNQVFEILLKWVETKDWEEALYAVIPKRKFQSGGKRDESHAVVEDGKGDAMAEEMLVVGSSQTII